MIVKSKNKSKIIKFICVMLGAVFAFTTSIVYGAFSWSRSHNSGYTTGAYLSNQSYQIINDTLPNGIPFGDGAKDYEIALQYSYYYSFSFYVEYEMSWSNSKDTSNVILQFSNRDAWIVDSSRIYYRDTVSAGSGKLPIIVGVDFVNCYDEDYYGATLTINIKNVSINSSASSLDTTGVAGTAYSEYLSRKQSSYTGTDAYIVAYNPTDVGSYQPTAPVGKTAFSISTDSANETKKLFGNKNYLGLGVYVITGSSAINLVATIKGSWVDSSGNAATGAANIVENTIKYNYTDSWAGETYDESKGVFEKRSYKYTIPAHSAVYVDIADSVEVVTRGMSSDADYSNYHIKTDLALNTTSSDDYLTFTTGIATDTISTQTLTGVSYDTRSSSDYTIINSSRYNAGLYTMSGGEQTFKTQIKVVNNTASKMTVSVSYTLVAYISNGNSLSEYGTTYSFTDATHWAREEYSYSSVTVSSSNSGLIIAPYSAMTISTSFTAPAELGIALAANENYKNKDVWLELVPTVTPTTSTATDARMVLEVEVSGTTAKLYAKNISTSPVYDYTLNFRYSYYNLNLGSVQSLTTAPTSWDIEYWKYYTKSGDTYSQVTGSTTAKIPEFVAGTYYKLSGDGWTTTTSQVSAYASIVVNPGEKVYMQAVTLESADIYDFSYSVITCSATTADDVTLVNEATGKAYLKNSSTTTSYYVRFANTETIDNFFVDGGYNYLYGLIRPGQVIPINITATTSMLEVESVADTAGSLPTSLWSSTSVVEKLKAMYETKTT